MHAILGIVNAIQANMNQGRLYYTLLVCSVTSKKLSTPLNIIFCWINSTSRQLLWLWWINQTMIFILNNNLVPRVLSYPALRVGETTRDEVDLNNRTQTTHIADYISK